MELKWTDLSCLGLDGERPHGDAEDAFKGIVAKRMVAIELDHLMQAKLQISRGALDCGPVFISLL